MIPDALNIQEYRKVLLAWWEMNRREYPWRHERTAYRTVVAELMLRRTQADQVVPVFLRFIEEYPNLTAAAAAAPHRIRRLLYPLGLAWRIESVLAFLREAYLCYGDELPVDAKTLQELPGVGDYVGAAVACFAGGQPVALIDTNVVRVQGRLFGGDTRGEARRRKDVKELAAQAVDPERPAEYHYALLDFAAKVCLARKPLCSICPFARKQRCEYYVTATK